MPNETNQRQIAFVLRDFQRKFGPHPLLSTESIAGYEELIEDYVDCLAPLDFNEMMAVKELADSTLEIARMRRQMALLIERKVRAHHVFQQQRAAAVAKKNEAIAAAATATATPAESAAPAAAEPENPAAGTAAQRVFEFEDDLHGHMNEIDTVLKKKPEDLIHSRIFAANLVLYERFEKLLNNAIARRNLALKQLEAYRNGLGKALQGIIAAQATKGPALIDHMKPSLPASDSETAK